MASQVLEHAQEPASVKKEALVLLALSGEPFPKGSFEEHFRVGVVPQSLDSFRWDQADKLGEFLLAHLGFLPRLGGVVLTPTDAEDGPRLVGVGFLGKCHHYAQVKVAGVENHRSL